MSHRFYRSQRLLSQSDFSNVFSLTEVKQSSKAGVFLGVYSNNYSSRLGMVLAKKHISSAVQRNFIKRVIREVFRQRQQQDLSSFGVDMVFLARSGITLIPRKELYSFIELELNSFISKAELFKNERTSESVSN